MLAIRLASIGRPKRCVLIAQPAATRSRDQDTLRVAVIVAPLTPWRTRSEEPIRRSWRLLGEALEQPAAARMAQLAQRLRLDLRIRSRVTSKSWPTSSSVWFARLADAEAHA
jgi:hypothetical protein